MQKYKIIHDFSSFANIGVAAPKTPTHVDSDNNNEVIFGCVITVQLI